MSNALHNFAFISYNHKDVKWAKWLQKKLEWYRLPSEIHNEFEDTRYIRPVFRDRDELNSGILNDELRNRLKASKYLIVICSPNSAQSTWVSDEVQAFINMGRLQNIIPFIVDGEPRDECFPLSLRRWNIENPDKQLLGISIVDDGERNCQKAFIRVVSRMLGVNFDVLWQRHKRILYRRITSASSLSVSLVLLFLWLSIPIRLAISLIDDNNHHLPPIEIGTLCVAGSEYCFNSLDTVLTIAPIPGYMRGRYINCSISSVSRYDSLSTNVKLAIARNQTTEIQMRRNKEFAIHSGQILDEQSKPIVGAMVTVEGHTAMSDANGIFSIEFPIEEQSYSKQLVVTHPDYQSCVITSYASFCRFILRR